MKIESNRLELVSLTSRQLKLWIEDLPALEKELNCSYQGEALDGDFIDMLKGEYGITKDDSDDTVWKHFIFMIRKEDRVAVGSADFKNAPNKEGEVEIGYGIGKQFEHNGYMTEAVKALCSWAKKQNGVVTVIAETEKENKPSQKVLSRSGFQLYKENESLWWKI